MEEDYLDFEGGFLSAKNYLCSKIGTPYGEGKIFSGFDFTIVSHVEKVSSTEPPTTRSESKTVGTTTGEDVEKLYPDQPWLNIVHLDRTNPGQTEIYDIPVVAYVRQSQVQFLFGEIEFFLWLSHTVYAPTLSTSLKDFSERAFDDPLVATPFPKTFSKIVEGSHINVRASQKLEFEIADNGLRCSFHAAGFAEKEDGKYWVYDRWAPDPFESSWTNLGMIFHLKIINPDEKEITVTFDHQETCNEPPSVEGPWVQQTLYYLCLPQQPEDTLEALFDEIIWVYEKYGEPTHFGTKQYKFRDKLVQLRIMWTPHHIRATEFFADHLKYSINCSSKLDIIIDGLYQCDP